MFRKREVHSRPLSLASLAVLVLTVSAAGCLNHVSISRAAAPGAGSQSFHTRDGWTIVADTYRPAGRQIGVVLLLHQRGGSAADWSGLGAALAAAHIFAIAIDQRGAGRSTAGPGPVGDNAPWDTSGDIQAVIYAVSPHTPIGLAGASYGANNALIYAAAHPSEVSGVALLSPGANYNGLNALAPAARYHGKLFIMFSKNDAIAGAGPSQIYSVSPSGNKEMLGISGSAHGTHMLNATNIQNTVAFFTRLFGPGPHPHRVRAKAG